MNIELSAIDKERLLQRAQAAGYADVTDFVTAHVRALAEPMDAADGSLTQEELNASLAACDRGKAQIEQGKGLSVEQANQQTLKRLRDSLR